MPKRFKKIIMKLFDYMLIIETSIIRQININIDLLYFIDCEIY